MADVTVEQVADEMFKMVEETTGKKNLKPSDLTKAMVKKFGGEVDKKFCKKAIRALIESGRCVYSYFGGTFVTIPRIEGANPDHE
jgi:hypothetical protein